MTDEEIEAVPLIVVVGSIRSGTSCTSGIIHKLGACMGRKFQPNDKANPTGYYEAMGLKRIVVNHTRRVRRNKGEALPTPIIQLRNWGKSMRTHCLRQRFPAGGGKHPKLSFFGKEITEAWGPNLYVVRTNRPVEDIISSAKRLRWGSPSEIKAHLKAAKETYAGVPEERVFELDYVALLQDPASEIDKLMQFLPFDTTPEARLEAIAHVNPDMKHLEK